VVTTLVALYSLGVLVGLIVTDDRWPTRVLLSVLWPLGPLAFVIVVSGLTIVAIGLWPLIVLPLLAGLGTLAYLLA
jgi:hypothetical protein